MPAGMNHPRPDALPQTRRRLTVWVVGVLAVSSAALTVWVLVSRAEAPSAASSAAGRPDMHYNFLGFADLEQGVTPLYPLQPGRVLKVFAHDGDVVEADAPLFALEHKEAMDLIDAAEAAGAQTWGATLRIVARAKAFQTKEAFQVFAGL